jgi:hypothetical protein
MLVECLDVRSKGFSSNRACSPSNERIVADERT